MKAWLLALIATVPFCGPLREQVSAIEANEYFDGEGRQVFRQIIFYEAIGGELNVIAWRLDKGEMTWLEHPPAVLWVDENRLRYVEGASIRRTITQHDPETAARDAVPVAQRRGLRGEKR